MGPQYYGKLTQNVGQFYQNLCTPLDHSTTPLDHFTTQFHAPLELQSLLLRSHLTLDT